MLAHSSGRLFGPSVYPASRRTPLFWQWARPRINDLQAADRFGRFSPWLYTRVVLLMERHGLIDGIRVRMLRYQGCNELVSARKAVIFIQKGQDMAGRRLFCLFYDALNGLDDVALRPLSYLLPSCPCSLSSATLLTMNKLLGTFLLIFWLPYSFLVLDEWAALSRLWSNQSTCCLV